MGQACFIVVKTRYDACCFFTILHMFCNMRVVAPGMSRDSPSGRLGVRRMPEFRLIHGTHAGQCNSDVVCFCVCHFTRLFRISPIIWRHLIDGWICLVFFHGWRTSMRNRRAFICLSRVSCRVSCSLTKALSACVRALDVFRTMGCS